ncbi:hypothetical protein O1W68_06550 [Rhodococcus sp. H36-A4]|uniref:hypothetical protein n=1 Tax=Rhodococcus sp. H36-A4 TaxID=3004353 RepID=UPI0022AF6B91|nr:hypothetical protein [Rhodococcus sp. H36-A4]MCZ4077598.1 hypothetical protein [Rhodococcus sp. H36-A4]
MHIGMIGCTATSRIYPSLGLVAEPAGVELVSFTSILPHGEENWPEDPASAMRVLLDEAPPMPSLF